MEEYFRSQKTEQHFLQIETKPDQNLLCDFAQLANKPLLIYYFTRISERITKICNVQCMEIISFVYF